MRANTLRRMHACALAIIAAAMGNVVHAGVVLVDTNSWIDGDGLWQDGTKWSLLATPNSDQPMTLITNAGSKIVTINSATAAFNLTISNLTMRGLGAGINTLQLTNAPASTLRILSALNVGSNAVLLVTNSALRVEGLSGGTFTVDGRLTTLGGQLLASNTVNVGAAAGAQGTLTMAGGTNTFTAGLIIGNVANSTGAVWLTDGQLVVSNGLTLLGGSGTAEMTISNGTWLARNVTVAQSGTLRVAGGTNTLFSAVPTGIVLSIGGSGTVWVVGGQLVVTNNNTTIGTVSVGQMIVSNGSWLAKDVTVANNPGTRGTLTIAGGTSTLLSNLNIGVLGATGAVWLTGGTLIATNQPITIGVGGSSGQMTISNGNLHTSSISVSAGTLTVAGGTNNVNFNLSIAGSTVWLTGDAARLLVTNSTTIIGSSGTAQMIISNGIWLAKNVTVAGNAGSQGTLTVAGGTNNVDGLMTLGSSFCGSTGTVVVAGGRLFVTNATGNATLEVRSGTLLLNSGTLATDQLVLTNSCGRFIHTGGTLLAGTNIVSAALDADGDGIPNGVDLDPFDPADAASDPDGDGLTNLQEYQTGTNPTNSASFFGITAVTRISTNILVSWQTGSGKTNALERTTGAAGSYSNNFNVLTNIITSTTTNNYLDIGAATNVPAFYYRVRLVPSP